MPDEAIPTSAAQLAQEASDFQWDGNRLEPGIGIALSAVASAQCCFMPERSSA